MSTLPALAFQMMVLLSPLGPEQLKTALDPALLEKAEHLDVVSVSGKFSYAEYRQRGLTPQQRTDFPTHSVTPAAIPFGECRLNKERMSRKRGENCGYVLPLTREGGSINLLGFDEVTVRGSFSGTWRLAFADDALAVLQDSVAVGTLARSGTHRFQLKQLLERADLSRARQLVLILESGSGSAQVKEVSFSHTPRRSSDGGRGIWIWRRDLVLGHEESVLRRLTEEGVKKAYLQVGDDPEVFTPFLTQAARAGIEIYALDGSPGYIAAPRELWGRIGRIESYNRSHPGARFAGFQVDIEPYLNKDYASRKLYYATAYVELLARIKKSSALPLSVAVPFWFDTVPAGRRSLLQRVFEKADEVVVMSYRTDAKAVLEISRSALSLGEQFGVPVRLGIEMGTIPDEQHQEFDRCSPMSTDALQLGGSWWCKAGEYLVPGGRISFKNKLKELPSFMWTGIPFASFRGWVLHSYEELPPDHE